MNYIHLSFETITTEKAGKNEYLKNPGTTLCDDIIRHNLYEQLKWDGTFYGVTH